MQTEIDQFMRHTTWASYDTFWNTTLYGRRMVDMVGTSIYEWSSRVADYINYIKSLVQSLDDYITSLRLQLAQLRRPRGKAQMWYAQEKAKIDEQYKDLKDTQEYYDALALLLEVYKEKKKKILEEMKQDEEDAAASSESGGGVSASGGSSGGCPGEQYCRILRITRPRSNRTSAICCRGSSLHHTQRSQQENGGRIHKNCANKPRSERNQ